MMPSKSTVLSLLTSLLLVTAARAENEGLPDLDKATELQGQAKSPQDLEEVVKLGEQALKKGLDEDNTDFAKQLIVAALWQHSSQLAALIFERARPDPRWPQIRGLISPNLDKLLSHDDSFVEAHVLVAKLQALPRGKREKGLKSINRAVEIYTERKNKQELSKTLLLRAGLRQNSDDRLSDITKAIEADAENAEALQLRATVHIQRGELDKAISDFEEVLKKDPENFAVHQAIVGTYASLKQYDKAIEAANKVIELAPEEPRSYSLRAEAYERAEKFDDALDDWNKAVELAPSNGDMLLGRARLHFLREDNKSALADIERVLQNQPGRGPAVLLKSMIFAADENFAEAIKTLQHILRANPSNVDIRLQIASYYVADERPRRAIRVLTEILADDEDSWQALRGRGDALLSVGKHAEAIKDYEKALKMQPEHQSILNNLAWVLATSPKDEVRDGKRSVELALKACEVTDYKAAYILSTLGASYAESGNFEKAIEWSTKAVELTEKDLQEQIEQETDEAKIKELKEQAQIEQLKDELEHYEEGKPFRELQNVEEKPNPPANVTEA